MSTCHRMWQCCSRATIFGQWWRRLCSKLTKRYDLCRWNNANACSPTKTIPCCTTHTDTSLAWPNAVCLGYCNVANAFHSIIRTLVSTPIPNFKLWIFLPFHIPGAQNMTQCPKFVWNSLFKLISWGKEEMRLSFHVSATFAGRVSWARGCKMGHSHFPYRFASLFQISTMFSSRFQMLTQRAQFNNEHAATSGYARIRRTKWHRSGMQLHAWMLRECKFCNPHFVPNISDWNHEPLIFCSSQRYDTQYVMLDRERAPITDGRLSMFVNLRYFFAVFALDTCSLTYINWTSRNRTNAELKNFTTMFVYFKEPTCIKFRRTLFLTWDGFFGMQKNRCNNNLNFRSFVFSFISFVRRNIWSVFGRIGCQFDRNGVLLRRSYIRTNDHFVEEDVHRFIKTAAFECFQLQTSNQRNENWQSNRTKSLSEWIFKLIDKFGTISIYCFYFISFYLCKAQSSSNYISIWSTVHIAILAK